MAISSFCKLSNSYCIKRINKDCPRNGHTVHRLPPLTFKTCSVLSTAHSMQHPLRTYGFTQNKAHISLLRSKSELRRREYSIMCLQNQINDSIELEKEEEISRAVLIWRAIKLPMYTVAFTPVTVGTALAYWQTGLYSSGRYFMILASYILVIAWLNLSNDVYDFDTGADVNKKESVVNLFGGRKVINIVAWLLLALGFLGLGSVAMTTRNQRSILLLASAVFCFYLYQCPPFRLSYHGVGEPLLFLSFGPLSTIAFYLLHSTTSELPVTCTAIWSSILVGLTTSLILFCSHFHQIQDDKAVGKISPLVRLGTEAGSKVVKMAIIGLYSLLLVLGINQTIPFASVILCAMTLPMGNLIVSFVEKNHKDKSKIFMSKYLCVRLHTIFGVSLAIGLVVARMFAKQKLSHAIIL